MADTSDWSTVGMKTARPTLAHGGLPGEQDMYDKLHPGNTIEQQQQNWDSQYNSMKQTAINNTEQAKIDTAQQNYKDWFYGSGNQQGAQAQIQSRINDMSSLDLTATKQRAMDIMRDTLGREYAARGLSGSSNYNAQIAGGAVDVNQKIQDMYTQNTQNIASLQGWIGQQQQNIAGMGINAAQFQQQMATGQNQFSQNLAMQQQQFDWNKYYQQQQLELAQPNALNYLAGGASIAGGVASGYGALQAGNYYAQMANQNQMNSYDNYQNNPFMNQNTYY